MEAAILLLLAFGVLALINAIFDSIG